MSEARPRPDRLTAVERWQSSELERARLKMTKLNAVAADRQADVVRIESDIADLQALTRKQAGDALRLNADALLRLNEFNTLRQEQLLKARHSYEQAAHQADHAQRDVLRLFENRSVVQRLLERRQELAIQEQQRSMQKRLDEGALSRAPHSQTGTNGAEDQGHGD